MKLRTGLLLGVTFAAGVLAGPSSAILARQFGIQLLPVAWAQDSAHSETYRLLTLFGDVFERVRAEYVEPVKDQDLVENAINGMLTGLDPHSNYMNAKTFRDMQVQTRGEFGGLGIEVTQDNGFIKVISPIDDTPASRAGSEGGRPDPGARRQVGAGPVAERRGRQDARPAGQQDQADDQARGRRQPAGTQPDPRSDQDPGGEVAPGGQRHRLYPPDQLQRADRQRAAQGVHPDQGAGRRPPARHRARPAQQPGRVARPGGRGVRRLHRRGRGRLHPRAPPRGQPALGRQGRRHHRQPAGGGADQRWLRLGERDRRRRACRTIAARCWSARAASARARCRR